MYDTRTAPSAPAALRRYQELLADQNRLLAEQNVLLERIQAFTVLAAAPAPPPTAGSHRDPPVPPPTAVQRHILLLLADGTKDSVIARRLGVSERSVRRHVGSLAERAGASNRFTLALAATRLGWLPA